MTDLTKIKIGTRVKLTKQMENPNSSWLPIEDGMPAGLEGTVDYISLDGPKELQMIGVKWDNGRGLGLLPHVDSFDIVQPTEEGASACVSTSDHSITGSAQRGG